MKLVSPTYGISDFHPADLFLLCFLPTCSFPPPFPCHWISPNGRHSVPVQTPPLKPTSQMLPVAFGHQIRWLCLSLPAPGLSLALDTHNHTTFLEFHLPWHARDYTVTISLLRTRLSLSLVLLPHSSAKLGRILCPCSCLPTCFPITSPSFKHSGHAQICNASPNMHSKTSFSH